MHRIPVGRPALVGNEKAYVMECMDSTWISGGGGKFIDQFESLFASFCGSKHAVSCANGTAALHLALLVYGVGPGDEIIVPALTFVATANAVRHCGASPVFVDSDPGTWTIDPALIEQAITPRTRGVIAVHLFGHSADMDAIMDVARRHDLFVIEDAAEAHGASYKGRPVGSLGDIAAFSFYANKIIATGEGGAVVTDDASVAEKVRQLAGHGMDPNRRYWFPVVGYNYRMSHIAAAIGVGQLEMAEWHIGQRRMVAALYLRRLTSVEEIVLPVEMPWATSVYWMFSVILSNKLAVHRDDVILQLADQGIETRPMFPAIHTLPPYRDATRSSLPVAEHLANRGITLPTWAGMTEDEVEFVASTLISALACGG